MPKTSMNQSYLPRQLMSALNEALADTPVVCLLGARQCGKSTLAKQCAPDRYYISLDDNNYRNLALNDPQGFIDTLPDRVTIDEVQRVPELTLAIKRSVDMDRRAGRFLLTGSANLLQLPRLADSLAGRMECLYLSPFTVSEIEQSPRNFLIYWMKNGIEANLGVGDVFSKNTLPARLLAGGYPEAFRRQPQRARIWQQQYVKSLIERDIHDIASIKAGEDISRLLEYVSINTAQLSNVTSISKALGHTRTTIERYLSILEKLFLIRKLPAWHNNESKRLVKTPKIHVCDSGLAATLSNIREDQWNEKRTRFGYLLESFIVQQLMAMASWTPDSIRFFHYRDKDQVEVDVVIESQGNIWGIEVKTAASVNENDGKGLLKLANLVGDVFQGGIVFYNGTATLPLHKKSNISAVPISKLWE